MRIDFIGTRTKKSKSGTKVLELTQRNSDALAYVQAPRCRICHKYKYSLGIYASRLLHKQQDIETQLLRYPMKMCPLGCVCLTNTILKTSVKICYCWLTTNSVTTTTCMITEN
jgi:hypothetical protein